MTTPDSELDLDLSRRKLLAAAGIAGGAVVAASLVGSGAAEAAPAARPAADPVATPPVAGLHLQFGADASSEMVVSWHTLQPVQQSRASCSGGSTAGSSRPSRPRRSATPTRKSKQTVYAYHAKIGRLQPDTAYLYARAARRRRAGVRRRSAPRRAGARAFTFTSFGDQGTPTLGKQFEPPAGVTLANAAVRQRQSRLAGGGRHDARRRAAAAAVPPVQRRSLLRQSRRGPGAHLVGFLGEQQPQRPQPPVDAVGRQPRERARQRADRLSGLPDLFRGAGRRPARPM